MESKKKQHKARAAKLSERENAGRNTIIACERLLRRVGLVSGVSRRMGEGDSVKQKKKISGARVAN